MSAVINLAVALGSERSSAYVRKTEVKWTRTDKDDSRLEDFQKRSVKGASMPTVSFEGTFDSQAARAGLASYQAIDGFLPFTLGVEPGAAAGSSAILGAIALRTQSMSFEFGEVQQLMAEAYANEGLDVGVILANTFFDGGRGAGTHAGEVVELPPITATQAIRGTFHVIRPVKGTGITVDAVLESDAAAAMDGAPVARYTLPQAAGVVAVHFEIPGPITDTHWRWTVTAAGTDFWAAWLGAVAVVDIQE